MSVGYQWVRARVRHARAGGAVNAFDYAADYVLAPMQGDSAAPWPLGSNAPGLFALLDRDHGEGSGEAAQWARAKLRQDGAGAETLGGRLWLLTQPRTLGFVFNPVSFWLFEDGEGRLRAVLAEVNNTFGERCAYVCRHADDAPIGAGDRISARKTLYVSPFQERSGRYQFRFDWRADRIGVQIWFEDARGRGMAASLTGERLALTAGRLWASFARYPFGSLGVVALIFWQALKLRLKGERYRPHNSAVAKEGAP